MVSRGLGSLQKGVAEVRAFELFLEISILYFSFKFMFLGALGLGILQLRIRSHLLARALMYLTECPFVLQSATFLVGGSALGKWILDLDCILTVAEFLISSEFFRNGFPSKLAVVVAHLAQVRLNVYGRVNEHVSLHTPSHFAMAFLAVSSMASLMREVLFSGIVMALVLIMRGTIVEFLYERFLVATAEIVLEERVRICVIEVGSVEDIVILVHTVLHVRELAAEVD